MIVEEAMHIEEAILKQMHITEYQVVRRFYSRRNEVYKINALLGDGTRMDFVYKTYLEGDMEREYHFLSQTQGVKTPKVLAKGENSLCLEYINGQLLLEKLEEAERAGAPFYPYLSLLIDFLERFYKAWPGYAYGDINFRNFIIAEDGIHGIDLEETREGKIAADIGKVAAYLLTYDPACTLYKKEIVDYFINSSAGKLNIQKNDIADEQCKELDYMKVRRQLRLDKLYQ